MTLVLQCVVVLILMLLGVSETHIGRDEQQTLRLVGSLSNVNITLNIIWKTIAENVGICSRRCYKDEHCVWLAYNFIDNICQGYNATYTEKDAQAYPSTQGIKNYFFTGKKLSLFGLETSASSVYSSLYDTNLAIDSDPDTFYHSAVETTNYPYLTLQWNASITVTSVVVFKRWDRLHRFETVSVFVGIYNGEFNLCNRVLAITVDITTLFACPHPMEGDTVKIEHRGPLGEEQRILEVAEVEVYGY